MIYYIVGERFITKYDVSFDEEVLLDIRQSLIDNCSFVTRETTMSNLDEEKFLKFSSDEYSEIYDLNKIEQDDDSSINKYTYIIKKYPKLVKIIDGILNKDCNSLYELFNTYEVECPLNYQEMINEIVSDIKHNNYEDINEANSKIDYARKCIELKELNKNIQSTYYYYHLLKNSISFLAIDNINLVSVYHYNSFFENGNYEFDENTEKVLKIKMPF